MLLNQKLQGMVFGKWRGDAFGKWWLFTLYICEMLSYQFLCTTINVRKHTILHKNNHRTIVMWQNRFRFHLQLSLQIWSNNKGGCETTPYFHFFWMQGLFLDSVNVFFCPNWTVVTVNFSIKAKVGFFTPQKDSIVIQHQPPSEQGIKLQKFYESPSPHLAVSAQPWFWLKTFCMDWKISDTLTLLCRECLLASTTTVGTFSKRVDFLSSYTQENTQFPCCFKFLYHLSYGTWRLWFSSYLLYTVNYFIAATEFYKFWQNNFISSAFDSNFGMMMW